MQNFKSIAGFFLVIMMCVSCNDLKESIYTEEVLEYDLNTVSTAYGYKGKAVFREFSDGSGVEVSITLEGEHSKNEYYFPAHLHFGPFQQGEHALMAEHLNPVDIRPLKSVTIIRDFSLEQLNAEYYHIKVHLAEEGPDYNVILAAGNVGEYGGSTE
ncbi:hypothetical protein GCM10028791_42310 [Echinicola sediminis]